MNNYFGNKPDNRKDQQCRYFSRGFCGKSEGLCPYGHFGPVEMEYRRNLKEYSTDYLTNNSFNTFRSSSVERSFDRSPDRISLNISPRRSFDRSPYRRSYDRSPDRSPFNRSPDRRSYDRSPDRRSLNISPRSSFDRSPYRRSYDRSPDRRSFNNSPRRSFDRSLDRSPFNRSPDRRSYDRSPGRRSFNNSPRRSFDRSLDRSPFNRSPDRRSYDRSPGRRSFNNSPVRRSSDRSFRRKNRKRSFKRSSFDKKTFCRPAIMKLLKLDTSSNSSAKLPRRKRVFSPDKSKKSPDQLEKNTNNLNDFLIQKTIDPSNINLLEKLNSSEGSNSPTENPSKFKFIDHRRPSFKSVKNIKKDKPIEPELKEEFENCDIDDFSLLGKIDDKIRNSFECWLWQKEVNMYQHYLPCGEKIRKQFTIFQKDLVNNPLFDLVPEDFDLNKFNENVFNKIKEWKNIEYCEQSGDDAYEFDEEDIEFYCNDIYKRLIEKYEKPDKILENDTKKSDSFSNDNEFNDNDYRLDDNDKADNNLIKDGKGILNNNLINKDKSSSNLINKDKSSNNLNNDGNKILNINLIKKEEILNNENNKTTNLIKIFLNGKNDLNNDNKTNNDKGINKNKIGAKITDENKIDDKIDAKITDENKIDHRIDNKSTKLNDKKIDKSIDIITID